MKSYFKNYPQLFGKKKIIKLEKIFSLFPPLFVTCFICFPSSGTSNRLYPSYGILIGSSTTCLQQKRKLLRIFFMYHKNPFCQLQIKPIYLYLEYIQLFSQNYLLEDLLVHIYINKDLIFIHQSLMCLFFRKHLYFLPFFLYKQSPYNLYPYEKIRVVIR